MRLIAIILALLLLSGCAGGYQWHQAEDVRAVRIVKIETPIAAVFCSNLLRAQKEGCAVRMLNTETGEYSCVLISLPGRMDVVRHEAGGHCMGQDHT